MSSSEKDSVTNRINKRLSDFTVTTGKQTIFKVHDQLRELNLSSSFEPMILAIGPYHSRKKHLKSMEEIKLLFLKQLLQSENINMLVKTMRKLLKGTRNCYTGLSDRSLTKTTNDDLVEIMVIEVAFLVQVFRKIENINLK
jgi:hypothetical protein